MLGPSKAGTLKSPTTKVAASRRIDKNRNIRVKGQGHPVWQCCCLLGLLYPIFSSTHIILLDKANADYERSLCNKAVVGNPSGTTPIAL